MRAILAQKNRSETSNTLATIEIKVIRARADRKLVDRKRRSIAEECVKLITLTKKGIIKRLPTTGW